ncbi:hypothetical protein DXG03_001959 [Asterophora parasitica]|uniref:Uncharacterized protein n=1 Tax=Asterophora parasitica TaxID=117018 RepID=A0A9P7GB90_9AGAR|nr:hypothetical protein DXG03_001959 [Asterophora parasitica]
MTGELPHAIPGVPYITVDEVTPRGPSSTSTISSSSIASRTTSPFRPPPDSKHKGFTKHARTPSYASRPSLDSLDSNSSSSSHVAHSFLDIKERKAPPPPLHLDSSNLHPTTEAKAYTIVGNTPPAKATFETGALSPRRVGSRRSSYIAASPLSSDPSTPSTAGDAHSPSSPQMPSEEEVFRRRHEKVMRTLGEHVPIDLISSFVPRPTTPILTTIKKTNILPVPKILNVTVFPEPPTPPPAETTSKTPTPSTRIARRASITISNVTANLLPSGHARNKSREILGLDTPTTPRRSTSSTSYRPDPTVTSSSSPLSPLSPICPRVRMLKDSDRAGKLARRASISTPTFLPTSPKRDRFHGPPSSPPRPRLRAGLASTTTPGRDSVYVDIDATRPESMLVLSPLVFSKQASMLPEFKYVVEDEDGARPAKKVDEDDDADEGTTGSRTPPPTRLKHNLYARSDMGHGHKRYTHSNPHLPLLSSAPRAETPFQDYRDETRARAETPEPRRLGNSHAWLWSSSRTKVNVDLSGAQKELVKDKAGGRRDFVQRRERRQGWSGEWNQGDMQDVIAKLRNLK